MTKILVAGAGKSSSYLIHYLVSQAPRNKWMITVADGNADAIAEKIKGKANAKMEVLDITDQAHRQRLVAESDIVISLMPPHLHIHLAKDCLQFKKNLITSSYISPEIKAMDEDVRRAGLMFMCEMGLDPGIDHMTANQIIHSVQKVAATIISFKSYCGGLIAPESDNNPWHYKFSWNPRNIITAGQGGAKYLLNNKVVEVPYEQIFENNKNIQVEGIGPLAYYPNRDSLRYLELYDVPEIKTFLRATLRYPDFCIGWQAIIKLGLNDENDRFDTTGYTYAKWLRKKINFQSKPEDMLEHLTGLLPDKHRKKVIKMLESLGLMDEVALKPGKFTSAEILLTLLEEKWKMAPNDKDMVVMRHEVEYLHRDRPINLMSTMVIKGENRELSAMAKTVGMPMGILAKLILNKTIEPPKGVHIPNMPSVYRPVINELKHHGIDFIEEVK